MGEVWCVAGSRRVVGGWGGPHTRDIGGKPWVGVWWFGSILGLRLKQVCCAPKRGENLTPELDSPHGNKELPFKMDRLAEDRRSAEAQDLSIPPVNIHSLLLDFHVLP
uniref:Uncharacterized protein n=1 Tax=Knipowitschia caucasica TaxID=637954 RepID=A0AAV2IVD0_KNICA